MRTTKMREWFACTFPGNAICGSVAAAAARSSERCDTGGAAAFNSEFTPASTTMTRARHIHAARGRRKEDGRGAGWGTASAEPNFNHGVAVVAHRLYSGVGRVGNTDSVCNITTTETPKNGQLVPEMAKRWIGARPASFRYLNSNEHYLV